MRAFDLANRPRNDRLHHALRLDRGRQVLECVLANIHAGLVLAALQQVDRQLAQAIGVMFAGNGMSFRNGLTEERVESAAKSFLWCHL